MKLLYITAVLCFLVASATANESVGVYTDPAHPGKCVVDDIVLSPGDIGQYPNGCGRMICGGGGRVTFQECGKIVVGHGLVLGPSKTPDADYLDCCDTVYAAP